MEKLIKYVEEVLGQKLVPKVFNTEQMGKLPYYMGSMYLLHHAQLMGQEIILVEMQHKLESIQQVETHLNLLKSQLAILPVLVTENIQSFQRKRLFEKGINFIVPGSQLYLPSLLINFEEGFVKLEKKKEKLLPSAQCLLIYHILKRNARLEQLTLKEVASLFGYSSMGITKAVNNLYQQGICDVRGTKDKHIHFIEPVPELWKVALLRLASPVHKTIFADNNPQQYLLKTYTSALPIYSDMNPSRRNYFAMGKDIFYDLEKTGKLKNMNEMEGEFGFEVWKYDPAVIPRLLNYSPDVIDPLSLYLCMKDDPDERTQDALELIIEKYIW